MTIAQIGPYSRPHMLAKIDGRTKEARLLEAARASLARHVGGSPNDIQRVLIERAQPLDGLHRDDGPGDARSRDDERARKSAISGMEQFAAADAARSWREGCASREAA